MEEKFNDATNQRPQGERIIDAELVKIDLVSFSKQIKEEQAWKDNDRNAITVFKTDGLRIVLISKGQMLTLHKGIPHNVLAMEETIFLLTLTTTMDENK